MGRTRRSPTRCCKQAVFSLPDEELGQPLMELEEGAPLEVIGFSRTFLLVRAQGLEGYVKGQGLTTYETRYLPEEDPPAYEILVNKSNFMVSVYRLDENGQRVGEPIRAEIAALGKRSTPTPSGRYVLGFKALRRASPHQTPHGITYLRGRCLHGIPLWAGRALNQRMGGRSWAPSRPAAVCAWILISPALSTSTVPATQR